MFDVIKTVVTAVLDFGCSLIGYTKDGVVKLTEIVTTLWF
jgi:hypothetical protein